MQLLPKSFKLRYQKRISISTGQALCSPTPSAILSAGESMRARFRRMPVRNNDSSINRVSPTSWPMSCGGIITQPVDLGAYSVAISRKRCCSAISCSQLIRVQFLYILLVPIGLFDCFKPTLRQLECDPGQLLALFSCCMRRCSRFEQFLFFGQPGLVSAIIGFSAVVR